jgi:hypothetical protein
LSMTEEGSICKPEMGGGLARNSYHKAAFGFFDRTGLPPLTLEEEPHGCQ